MEIIWKFLIAFAILSGIAALVALAKRKKRDMKNDDFDERQELIRGKGYALGFWTMAMFLVSYWVSLAFVDNLIEYANSFAFVGFTLGIASAVVYFIINDAFFTAKQRPLSYLLICILMVLGNGVPLVLEFCDGMTFDKLLKDVRVSNLCCVGLFLTVAITIIIKMLRSRNEEADE